GGHQSPVVEGTVPFFCHRLSDSGIGDGLAVVAYHEQTQDLRGEVYGQRANAAVSHHELTDPWVITAEDALGIDVAHGILGDRETGTAAPGRVAGNVGTSIVGREIPSRLTESARTDVLFPNQDGIAGAVS